MNMKALVLCALMSAHVFVDVCPAFACPVSSRLSGNDLGLLGKRATGRSREHPRCAGRGRVEAAADQRGEAVARKRHRLTERRHAGVVVRGEPASRLLLGPRAIRAREDVRRTYEAVVAGRPDESRVAVAGQRDTRPEVASCALPGRGEHLLQQPGRSGARIHPRRAVLVAVVEVAADQGRIAV